MYKCMMCPMKTQLSMVSMTEPNVQSVFVDTSFFKAFFDPKDEFHKKALVIWKKLKEKQMPLLTTNYILDESFTLIRIRCTLPVAIKLRYLLYRYSSIISIERVTVDDEVHVWEWFEKDWSRLSYTDCVSFVVMKRLGITDVATFDEHFKRAGFHVMST